MNKEQTALDVSRDIEVAKVMPQQAALTLTDEMLESLVDDFDEAYRRHLKSKLSREASIAAMGELMWLARGVLGQGDAQKYRLAAEHVGIVFTEPDSFGRIVAINKRAENVEIAAAPKVDAAVPADLGARELTNEQIVEITRPFWNEKIRWFDVVGLYRFLESRLAAASQGAPKEADPVAIPLMPERVVDTLIPKGMLYTDLGALDLLHQFAVNVQNEFKARLPSAAPAVTLQEAAQPVAWMKERVYSEGKELSLHKPRGDGWIPLYAAPIGQQASRNAVLEAAELRNEGYDVICDRRDLFDFLRAAWRNGQDHHGEMDERERWDLATQHATKAIQGWATLRHILQAGSDPAQQDSKEQGNGN